ncbi:exonuclease domain-containing protein [Haematococcus lacustris]|uniref:Exonuclease domain-containing protein n=1 Tax=Haematococcus lacustris TaxID=44745 RepID=A0A699ZMV4_HAELA|nr:exonuclease domain-containing protein [Haematococcus lacustris]
MDARGNAAVSDGSAVAEPVALDCEMVRVGPEKVRRALARVAMVDQNGEVLLDRWVRPEEPVTDYR